MTVNEEKSAASHKLIPLKIIVFLFFGAQQCLNPFLRYHMINLNFDSDEIRTVTIASALLSFIGPIVIAWIMDRVALKRPFSYGNYLRMFLTFCMLMSALFYGLLLVLPFDGNVKGEIKLNEVTFACNLEGAHIFQERCGERKQCHNMESHKGKLNLTNCVYTCQKPTQFENLGRPFKTDEYQKQQQLPQSSIPTEPSSEDYYEGETEAEPAPTPAPAEIKITPSRIDPPHVCHKRERGSDLSEDYTCYAFTVNTKFVELEVESAENYLAKVNDSFEADWCRYKLDGFQCLIPEKQVTWMKATKNNSECIPMIECNITQPYESAESFLSDSVCVIVPASSIFWPYFILRYLGDLFAISVHLLLNVAIIVATRETSAGRGNIGHQLMFGAIGIFVFSGLLGALHTGFSGVQGLHSFDHVIPISVFCVSMVIGAVIVLCSSKLPLTPSEWWWHTKCGMLAIPMSAIKRYRSVILGICTVAFVLGTLWNTMETIRQWYAANLMEVFAEEMGEKTCYQLFVYTIGSILAILIVYKVERIVDFLGHSNIFIIGLVSFMIRFTLVFKPYAYCLELLEPLSWYLPWVTFILFSRHLIAKKFLVLGQATLIILYHSFSKGLGTWLGSSDELADSSKRAFLETNVDILAIIACIVAIIYLILYNFVLAPVPTDHLAPNNDDANLSPQRVFHDERARKGYFRY